MHRFDAGQPPLTTALAPGPAPAPGPTTASPRGANRRRASVRKPTSTRSHARITPPPWLDASHGPLCDSAGAWNAGAWNGGDLDRCPLPLLDPYNAALMGPGDSVPYKTSAYPGDAECLALDAAEPSMAPPARASSAISFETYTSSSTGCSLSPVQTEPSDIMTVISRSSRDPSPLGRACIPPDLVAPALDGHLVCLGPRCHQSFPSEDELTAHVQSQHTHSCNWAGCDHPSFASRDGLIWHVKAEHLLVCPSPGCTETSFQSTRVLTAHIAVAHPEAGKDGVKEWQLSPSMCRREITPNLQRTDSSQSGSTVKAEASSGGVQSDTIIKQLLSVAVCKRKCQEQLRSVVEKKAKKSAGTPKAADSPTDLVRNRASRLVEMASFPIVFEHAVLPFLAEFIPKWSGPRHVVSVTRGRTPQARRICIMTPAEMSRARKLTIASHVKDLLPENFRHVVSFIFSVGKLDRSTFARGLGPSHLDDVCTPRNPYFFPSPCMGDSIGIAGKGAFGDSTATLGPCLSFGGGSYWLGNFHPFLEAYQCLDNVSIEHPSPQDRSGCIGKAHDAMSSGDNFKVGDLQVTSGLNLQTTRISHDPYWEDCCKDPPFVVTDWALIVAQASTANILRRFPCDSQPLFKETLVKSTAAVTPGASIVSSGRTSGHQRGQVCEIPAYVSGEENGTRKATREWFVEEPYHYDDEDAWIRGGIGVEGDSGAAIVDADSGALVGQLWGRNRYYGPGPRHTYFTPIADIFDDIQEKCGQQDRPRLPQHRDEDDCYAVYPSCRQCFDLRTYLDSRRSSRMSLQSMIMGPGGGDGDQDLTSIEAVSELATPRDYQRYIGVEEAGSSFNGIPSPLTMAPFGPSTPIIQDVRTPYAPMLDVDDLYDTEPDAVPGPSRKRGAAFSGTETGLFAVEPSLEQRQKRQRAIE